MIRATEECPNCHHRPGIRDAMDDALIALENGQPVPVEVLKRLPPFRASMIARVVGMAGGTLERGNPEQVRAEAVRVGGSGELGDWWAGGN